MIKLMVINRIDACISRQKMGGGGDCGLYPSAAYSGEMWYVCVLWGGEQVVAPSAVKPRGHGRSTADNHSL